jgi:hypothetical protein
VQIERRRGYLESDHYRSNHDLRGKIVRTSAQREHNREYMRQKRMDAAYYDAELEQQRDTRARGGAPKRCKGPSCQSDDPEAEQRLRASGVCSFCARVQCSNTYIDGFIAGWPAERLKQYMRWTGSMEMQYGVLCWAPWLNQAQKKRWEDARQRLREAAPEESDHVVRELLAAPRAMECDGCAVRRRLQSERSESVKC